MIFIDNILIVNLCNTYKDNCSKEYLKSITTGDWKIEKKKVNKIKYIVGLYKKQIISAYTIVEQPTYISDENRFRFCNVVENTNLLTKLKSKYDNNLIMYGPILYLNCYDL